MLIVHVDVIDEDHQAGVCHICSERRLQIVLRSDMVEPNRGVAGADLTVDRATIRSAMHTSRHEAKCLHRKSCAAGMS